MFGIFGRYKQILALLFLHSQVLNEIASSIAWLKEKETHTMSQLDDIVAELAVVKADADNLVAANSAALKSLAAQSAQIASLQAQIAAGSQVTVQDLAPIKTAVDAVKADIEAALPPPAPPAA